MSSNDRRTNNVALTQDAIRAHRAAQDRIAPFLPPEMAQAMWIARLSEHYDPAAGKFAIPALGVGGSFLTPVVREKTEGNHTREHDPDSVLGSGIPNYEIHPKWSGYNRYESKGVGSSSRRLGTKEGGWEYSPDKGRTWKPLHTEDEDLKLLKHPTFFKNH
jgi:hypothetical protein